MVVETKMGTLPLQTISSYKDSSAPFELSLNLVRAKNSYPNTPTEFTCKHVTKNGVWSPSVYLVLSLYIKEVCLPF
jgi:hypothetical protein